MDIYLNGPIEIALDVIEFDEHLPSIKLRVGIVAEKFDGSISVNTCCWVECAVFDLFVESLKSGKDALFHDMSNGLSVSVSAEDHKMAWFYTSTDIDSNEMRAGGNEFLADGDRERIISAFEYFPRWW